VRKDGIFIAVDVDDAVAADAAVAKKLTEACPVDIYAQGADGTLELVEKNLDECVLCRLCLDVVASDPTHPVKVIKLYDGGAEL
jgi:NAD-dependent dihydropyrimidine dehydrogenase PreA subunit